ncbi:MAG TPA: DUF1223 domain-containing protein, partial [Candidatus Elarobacter sp.]|nr:DUF1223 domain-containing protein [Candidatus Elarobacter sp.]
MSIALLIVGGYFFIANAQSTPPEAHLTPVVVELFTSEGCSSCPPADALLQRLQSQQPVAGADIIALEEHVDYWNHDGWVDPYSSPEWTERQQVYVTRNGNDAYTPELVVDGRSQFVGNNEREARREIEKAARASKIGVSITAKAYSNGSQRFAVSIGKLEGNNASDVAEVWLAVTEDGLTSSVSHGENSGRVLHHVATLRSLSKIGVADLHGTAVSFTGDPLVKISPQWNMEN